jgi:hypothetical protein
MKKKAKAKKSKVGRPEGRRPVLAMRIDQALYDKIAKVAATAGRSVAEEAAGRLNLSIIRNDAELRWIDAENQVRMWLDEQAAALKNEREAALRQWGYQPVQDTNGTFWAEPGIAIGEFTGVINPAITDALQQMLEPMIENAIRKANKS